MSSSVSGAAPSRSDTPASPPSQLSPSLGIPHQCRSSPAPQLPQAASLLPPSRWVNLFSSGLSSSSTALKHFDPEFVNGVAKVPSDVVCAGVTKWSKFLVGSFIGKRLPFFMVKREIEKVLKTKDSFNLTCDGSRYFIELPDSGHRQKLLDGGSIFIAGRILVIREWSSSVEGQEDQLSTIPLWINMVIPRELWTVEGIGFCASLFGTPLGMDEFTAKMAKTRFARVCVEVGVNFEYPASIPVDLGTRIGTVHAEYKWKAEACSGCSVFGHSLASCPRSQKEKAHDKERRWQPVAKQNLDQEKDAVLEVSNLPCNEETALQPVAQTGTGTAESETYYVSRKEVSPSENRFNILANLEDNENTVQETINDSGADAKWEKVKQLPGSEVHNPETLCETNDLGKERREVKEHSNLLPIENTKKFVGKVGDCLEICDVVLNSLQSSVAETSKQTSMSSAPHTKEANKGIVGKKANIMDKGGTNFDPSKFDPSNPDTWTEAMREADQNIAMVMARMKNPEPENPKAAKVDFRVKLVRGNSGAPTRSSTRNKR